MDTEAAVSNGPVAAAPQVLGPFTDGVWQDLEIKNDADDQEKAAGASAEAALRDELGLVVAADTLVVLAGSGASLGITSKAGEHLAPKMSDLWEAISHIDAFESAKSKLSAAIVAEKNLEHALSDAQARLALSPDDTDLARFLADAEAIVWQFGVRDIPTWEVNCGDPPDFGGALVSRCIVPLRPR